jgi:hypothetical protein
MSHSQCVPTNDVIQILMLTLECSWMRTVQVINRVYVQISLYPDVKPLVLTTTRYYVGDKILQRANEVVRFDPWKDLIQIQT